MRKRTRRKHYVLSNPIALAIDGARVIDDTRLGQLHELEGGALRAFQFGEATWAHWAVIAEVCKVARMLVELGVGPEVLPTVAAVEAFLQEAEQRHAATGSLGATGPALQAVRDLYEYHDLQRTSVDLSTYQRAVETTINRTRAGYHGRRQGAGVAGAR